MKTLLTAAALTLLSLSLSATEWKARWINTERCQSATNTWLVYRKTLTLDNLPATLPARIAADSKYWLWINGQLVVFEGGLKRGPTPRDTYYDLVDIAPFLTEGENLIAVLLWHFGQDGFSHLNSGKAALLFDAQSEEVNILSDESWQCALYEAYQNTGPPYPNYRLPESNIRFDARRELAYWNHPVFQSSLPSAVVIGKAGEAPFGRLIERPIPQWKDFGLSNYVGARQSGDTMFCKLPYNAQVTPYLKIEAQAGQVIHMFTDNYEGGSELNVRAEYVTRQGVQEYESYGWMNGHEVCYIIPQGVKILGLKYRETGYNAEFTGSFQCSDPFFTELWKRSARTLYVTMRDNYMDCPDRERAQWWGDEVNELGETFYALSPPAHKLAVKGIYELMNWQRPDGTLFSPLPAGNWSKELPLQMLASVGWYGFYTQYYYSADSTFVPHIYDRLRHYLHKVWRLDKSGLPRERSGEWNWGDWGENVDIGVLTTCWYYLALKAEHAFAIQLGKEQDALRIAEQMSTISKCFDTKYWTGSAYRAPGYRGETDDRSQAMAVLSGLASRDKYSALLKVLKTEYHASPYMEKYVLEALFAMGESTFALERMKERYSRMLQYPYTTLFEGWGIGAEGFGGGTINHAWSGGPLTLLSQKVCGIEPTSPGFKTFRIAPQMGSLSEAKASIHTLHGMIEVIIKKRNNKLQIETTIPQGTAAEYLSPTGKKKLLLPGTHSFSL
ncbi:alpha-L-rhamnosidase [Parabacteroides sp. PF5-5]|uniref:alpha-L-rhamnosidase-related protein n=1 Tax=unclassified Parabacteroides TaxID=2649774 RepID=UPI0024735C13|nr:MULTISPECIES: alpha-L-rhamnosidase C-terminal domain-containing protein [unclassified Parabacteroides]MDH6303786.1 alpha-L-rhamnosidase [Parabacteroides sp. PH5-39]MDH6314403.1 alpha-L-rhamnosidase [Parabacteroides sp. PF5-13]MDH6318532.1 alpha-L-rhamnosidase [Parabacteroides sp. PH5-13]MDH6322175.1 alpha-L-rhamnosidase [Parabacteroides sp. PH5-8]MDH6325745.1 alpha-L-rhamnosidase [Parabacteroides sp. PH5-41]